MIYTLPWPISVIAKMTKYVTPFIPGKFLNKLRRQNGYTEWILELISHIYQLRKYCSRVGLPYIWGELPLEKKVRPLLSMRKWAFKVEGYSWVKHAQLLFPTIPYRWITPFPWKGIHQVCGEGPCVVQMGLLKHKR